MEPALCEVPECGDPVYRFGLCKACYHRSWRNPEGFDVTQPRKRPGQKPAEDTSALEAENAALRAENRELRRVGCRLWVELSNAVGWLWLLKDALPREDIIPNKRLALEAGREIGLGEE